VSESREPGVDRLIRALTADGHPDELTGRDDALAAFRAAGEPRPADRVPSWHRGIPFRRPVNGWVPRRLVLVAAAGVAVIAGITAAAYTQALPGPAQDIAHTAFAPLGVPGGESAPGPGPTDVTADTPGTGTPAGSPRATHGYLITLAAARVRVPAGAVDVLAGRVTDDGRAAAGTRVWLVERAAEATQWKIAATAVTGPRGGFALVSPPLTTTVIFRVVVSGGAHSGPVRVTVPRTPSPASAGA